MTCDGNLEDAIVVCGKISNGRIIKGKYKVVEPGYMLIYQTLIPKSRKTLHNSFLL